MTETAIKTGEIGMRHKLQPIPLWIQWILATSLSIPLGWGIWGLAFLIPFLDSQSPIARFIFFAMIVMTFLPLGVSQWAILRRRIRHAVWWIPVTAIGVLLSLFVAFWSLSLFRLNPSSGLHFFIGAFFGGGFLGFLQWLVLKSAGKRAYWWILASGFGWMGSVSWFALYSMKFLFGSANPLEMAGWLILAGASGGMGGTIKGIALAWILAVPHNGDRASQKE
ncbi:hypothetical protein [Spirulina sp. 06S082]|uniref:hypothetical protein n=1 Tax=Spirulina sp. 06S082 TaxID=3110248 RepID=UPI002B21CD43|nr:hypothetical protein [Spirulina sp. 06S082]MEA5467283.1 hypothetical protein [Spirulina sp. 06S082]